MAKNKVKEFAEEAEKEADAEAAGAGETGADPEFGAGDAGGGTEDGATNVVPLRSVKNSETMRRAMLAAKDTIDAIEGHQSKIDDIMAKAKANCAPHRDKIKALVEKARTDYGIEKSVISTELADRRQRRRIAARVEKMKQDARDQYDFLKALETETAEAAKT